MFPVVVFCTISKGEDSRVKGIKSPFVTIASWIHCLNARYAEAYVHGWAREGKTSKEVEEILERRGMTPSKPVVIKCHKTPKEAVAFHSKLAVQMRNGEGSVVWNKGWNPYLKLYDEFCPKKYRAEEYDY